MSVAHHHDVSYGLNSQALDRLLEDRQLREELHGYRKIDRDFDIPYVGGYSRDGATIFVDRHLPERVELELDGRKREIDPVEFLRLHESFEKSLIDCLGYGYDAAHRAATGYERRGVLQRLGPDWWAPYQRMWRPYIRSDEHEKLERVPPSLDMAPYEAAPINRGLIARMQAAMGAERRYTKAEAQYTDTRGVGSRHCGPVRGWPIGDCEHFEAPRSCTLVRGAIEPRGGCRLWQAKE